ncbi:hypothetical protein QBZ16_005010 [Prototheca wickerhamii]|uniref:Cullin family profile domain-containing protein n=1 Tax=Prototheca wickerhamii TaxID=3111 RepID=A0AAD9MGF5_PROWI|nr:hypothetical protein QBZ16_005010 [Prototheca wickerhamii]
MSKLERPIGLEEGWQTMADGISKLKRLLEGESTEPPHDYSEQLYLRYRSSLEAYVSERVLPSLEGLEGAALLRQLCRRWDNHALMVRWMSRIFSYLDRYYVQRHNLHGTRDAGLLVWRDQALLALVEREREGEGADAPLLKATLATYQEVGMGTLAAYEADFEQVFLKRTAEYYRSLGARWLEACSTPEYLARVEATLSSEEARVNAYLHVSTRPKLLHAVETELIKAHSAALLEREGSGCAALLRDARTDDLTRLYRVFNRIPHGLDPVAIIFREHVERQGLDAVRAATEAAGARQAKEREAGRAARDGAAAPEHVFIKAAIDLHERYYRYVESYFGNASLFHKSLKEAFETFCNKLVGRVPVAEAMASYCDALLRKGSAAEKLTDEEVERQLDRVVKLLAYVSDKDVFSENYRTRLSKRLLGSHASSEDLEKGVLVRLKQQCGTQFTSKMEGMLQDLSLAKQKEEAFEAWLARGQGAAPPIDLAVTVLTTGFWPSFKQLDLNLPEEMVRSQDVFNQFHDEHTKKARRLTWQLSQGTVHVRAQFDKMYELVMTPPQAVILALFNEAEGELAYADIQSQTRIPGEDLDRLLASLTFAKHKLLVKSPLSKTVSPNDAFAVNAKFTDRMRRIKIAAPVLDQRRKVTEEINNDRQLAVQAALVRIMKSRKKLGHQQLIAEVVTQLQKMFSADVKLVKRSIEQLIDREFLERSPDDPSVYVYLA